MSRLSLISVTACTKQIGFRPYYIAGDKYLCAVINGANGLPLIIPALGGSIDQVALLDSVDGLLFTSSPSNVESRHCSGPASEPSTLHDSSCDATTLPLARTAIDTGISVLGVCRGFQEMNVTFGGSLHQRAYKVGISMDHREPTDQPLEVQYAPRHAIYVQPGGVLAGIGLSSESQVNSIHGQDVDRLAPGLQAEALVPDGLVRTISAEGAEAFALGTRWHPG